MPTSLHLVFEVSSVPMALPAEAIAEVVLLPRLKRFPAQPSLLEGVMNLRGRMVPVVTMARLLGMGALASGPFSPVVVLGGSEPWGALVDRALAVNSLRRSGEPPPPDLAFNDCVAAMAEGEGGLLVPVLNRERLLTRREIMVLGDFRRLAEERLEERGSADR
jgi:purine-binding chemotaxis protein CheW